MDYTLPDERRSVQRLCGETVGPLRLRAEPHGLPLSASVQDISVRGVGLVTDGPFDVDTTFDVQTGPWGKGVPEKLVAHVRHATMLPEGRWLLGCSFSRLLTIHDMEALG